MWVLFMEEGTKVYCIRVHLRHAGRILVTLHHKADRLGANDHFAAITRDNRVVKDERDMSSVFICFIILDLFVKHSSCVHIYFLFKCITSVLDIGKAICPELLSRSNQVPGNK